MKRPACKAASGENQPAERGCNLIGRTNQFASRKNHLTCSSKRQKLEGKRIACRRFGSATGAVALHTKGMTPRLFHRVIWRQDEREAVGGLHILADGEDGLFDLRQSVTGGIDGGFTGNDHAVFFPPAPPRAGEWLSYSVEGESAVHLKLCRLRRTRGLVVTG